MLTISALTSSFVTDVEIYKADGVTKLTDTDTVSTGCIIIGKSLNGTDLPAVTIVIKGDIDGDGLITVTDYGLFKSYLNKTTEITENEKIDAADATSDSRLTSTDYLYIKRHCEGTFNLFK